MSLYMGWSLISAEHESAGAQKDRPTVKEEKPHTF